MKAMLRLRMSSADAHYGGNLVDGAKIMALFGDVATELLIQNDGDEGLFRAYEQIDFLAPVFAGDYLEVYGEIISSGNTSRKMVFECYKVIAAETEVAPSAAKVLEKKVLVATATGTCVVPKNLQRK
ncbi:MAG: hotdog fold domain-containing protein [Candidatus Izemoplasmatales bacterium]|jgi:3-aminobutyryl-CoA ammonia-lyase|nr:hotdog fold domain-containing protein [Candidatus Izemoplasmatales bacterium]